MFISSFSARVFEEIPVPVKLAVSLGCLDRLLSEPLFPEKWFRLSVGAEEQRGGLFVGRTGKLHVILSSFSARVFEGICWKTRGD